MTTPYDPLLAHIRRFTPLNDSDADTLISHLRHRSLKKKEFLLKEQETCTASYFVLKGCLRLYFTHSNGVEQIIQFAIENWWITDQQSLDWQKPSRFFLQAVEPAEVAILDRSVAPQLFDAVPAMDRYFRLVVQRALAAFQQHMLYVYSLSGEERYHHFNDAFPEFVQRIPQYMVASYLGFTPEFISKIRRQRRK